MKRMSIFLCFALLLSLCGCGGASDRSVEDAVSSVPVVSAVEDENGYVIPASWSERSANDGTYGYVTADAGLPSVTSAEMSGGYLLTQTQGADTTVLCRYTMDGKLAGQVEVPPCSGTAEIQNISDFRFGADGLWLIYDCYDSDPETGELSGPDQYLQHWDYQGQCLLSLCLTETLELGDSYVSELALDQEDNPLVIAEDVLYFCDGDGAVAATAELPDICFDFCQDASGRLYLHDIFGDQVYSIRWADHTLGDLVLAVNNGEDIYPGGGDYDFLLLSDTALRGATLSAGTITELLSWEDLSLTDCVRGVGYVDGDTLLAVVQGLLLDNIQLLTLTRVPADEIPEKTVVRMAVPLADWLAEENYTWADAMDQKLVEAVNQFNRSSDTYRVEAETFSSAEELQLWMAAGDTPDLLMWDQNSGLEDAPSMAVYAKRGYLTDLEPLFAADEELSLDDFIPSILELAKSQAGGLYAMPIEFYCTAMFARSEYVGDSWTISDVLAAAQSLPEDMCVWADVTQMSMLESILFRCIGNFMDVDAAVCDFETQEFYDLLTLCRDYFPAETGDSYTEPEGGSLLSATAIIGTVTQFYTDSEDGYAAQEAQGRVMTGYPSAGSGLSIIFYYQISMFSQGQQQEGAWAFLRTLFTYEYQRERWSSVRYDAFNAREDLYLSNGFCTEEESQAARELVYSAQCLFPSVCPCWDIIQEEAAACFAGDKTVEETARIIQSRVSIYLGEQA